MFCDLSNEFTFIVAYSTNKLMCGKVSKLHFDWSPWSTRSFVQPIDRSKDHGQHRRDALLAANVFLIPNV